MLERYRANRERAPDRPGKRQGERLTLGAYDHFSAWRSLNSAPFHLFPQFCDVYGFRA